jgi:4-hydroxy-tetrahydrodipicolinate synthase
MDQLWVPILTHYGDGRIDTARVTAHLAAIRAEVKSILLAGSTGDGWDLDDARFAALIGLLGDARAFPAGTSVMVGTLRDTTANVVSRIGMIERALAERPTAARFAGVTVCPPIDAHADQAAIVRHYEAVLEASPWPISVYQLPQVTRCAIAPETLERLAQNPKVVMFKDSSGADAVAASGRDFGAVTLLRGAEGDYADHLKPAGRYDGFLLSTGNAFARPLRAILERAAKGDRDGAAAISSGLSRGIEALFAAATPLPFSNAFSNANRAADHILAHGRGWRAAPPPEAVTGDRLPPALLETAERVVAEHVGVPDVGYLARS